MTVYSIYVLLIIYNSLFYKVILNPKDITSPKVIGYSSVLTTVNGVEKLQFSAFPLES